VTVHNYARAGSALHEIPLETTFSLVTHSKLSSGNSDGLVFVYCPCIRTLRAIYRKPTLLVLSIVHMHLAHNALRAVECNCIIIYIAVTCLLFGCPLHH